MAFALTVAMELTPREKDKLLIFTAALLAERRLVAHLSLSDEQDYAVAFVILEQTQP